MPKCDFNNVAPPFFDCSIFFLVDEVFLKSSKSVWKHILNVFTNSKVRKKSKYVIKMKLTLKHRKQRKQKKTKKTSSPKEQVENTDLNKPVLNKIMATHN